jgi:hypothetical protein
LSWTSILEDFNLVEMVVVPQELLNHELNFNSRRLQFCWNGWPNIFFHLHLSSQDLHPQFWIWLNCVSHCWLIFFIKSSLVEIRSCKSSELIPSFMTPYPI